MEETHNPCGCTCICDPTVGRQFDQTSGRFNDRSAFSNNNQMDAVQQLNSMFTAKAQQTLSSDSQMNLASWILAQRSVTGQPG